MPKKKKVVEPVEEPVEVPTFEEVVLPQIKEAVQEAPPEPPKPAEVLLTVRVTEDFKDGALKARFEALGYSVIWKAGETREIPMNLFVRCIRSGAKFER